MKGTIHHNLLVHLGATGLIALLAAGCTSYQPLGQGSTVPWSKTRQLAAAPSPAVAPPSKVAAVRSRPAVPPSEPKVELVGVSIADRAGDHHRVRRGDRLSSLAQAYRVSVRELAEANGLQTPYVIYVGQRLRIPWAGAVVPGPRRPTVDRYVVRRGDTLGGIADRVGIAMRRLADTNDIGPPYDVYVGQTLTLDGSARGEVQAATVALGEPPPLSGSGFLWPANGKVVGAFGPAGRGQRRNGIDIAARKGAPVLAAEDGLVAYVGDHLRGYGRLILIRHGDDYITTYGHNAAILVTTGERVSRGQVIARVGDSGDVKRSQLHFELRKGRNPINPETVLVHEPTAVASRD